MSDPADRLRRLWAAGARPDLESFVGEVGPLGTAELAAVLRADQGERPRSRSRRSGRRPRRPTCTPWGPSCTSA